MKCFLPVWLLTVLVICGCATHPEPVVEAKPGELLVTPEYSLVGKVVAYNLAGRFVVLEFPVGRMPAVGQTLSVYRQGLKVGEAKITGPDRDTNTVADLISGEAQKGDEVRDR